MDRNFQHENEIWSIRSTLPNWKRSLDWQWWKSSSWWRIHPLQEHFLRRRYSSQASPGLSSQQQCHCLYLWYLSSCVYPQRRRHSSCGWEGIDASFSPHKYSSVSPMVPTLIRCISLAMVLLLSSVRTPSSPSKWRSARRTRSTSSGVLFYFTLFYVLGTDVKFSEVTSVQPVYDSLGDDCLAMSYFLTSGSIDIYTSVACMHDIDNENFGVTIMASADYSPDYTFHGIAGII